MRRLTLILFSVLIVQLLLAVVLFTGDQDMGAFQSNEKLLVVQLEDVDSIMIESSEQSLTLSKQQGSWQMPQHYDSPVSASKLQQMTDKVFTINTSWPVASTAVAAPRFKVAKSQFERKISFKKGTETLQTLYLGTSPGFKKIHARIDQQANIYRIELSAFEFSTKADDWIDQTLLKINKNELQQAKMAAFTLNKQEQAWYLEQLAAEHIEDQDAIGQFIDKLSNLTYSAILGVAEKAKYGLDKPELNFTLTDQAGKHINYRFGKLKDQSDYILKASSQPYYFKVAEFRIQTLLDTKLDTLSKIKNDDSVGNAQTQKTASEAKISGSIEHQ